MRDLQREIEFSKGLSRITKACRQEVDGATLEVYTEALCHQVEPDEWDRFTLDVIRSGRFTWFPKVAELLAALSDFRGEPRLDAEAATAYERVLECGIYTAEGGTTWNQRTVAESCGRVAAEAFMAAGGPHAFATSWDESKRRERFLAAYQQTACDRPNDRLLPAGAETKLLPVVVERVDPPKAEAASILARINPHLPPLDVRPPFAVTWSDERLRLLREQAAAITETRESVGV